MLKLAELSHSLKHTSHHTKAWNAQCGGEKKQPTKQKLYILSVQRHHCNFVIVAIEVVVVACVNFSGANRQSDHREG